MCTKSQVNRAMRKANWQYFISLMQADIKSLELSNQKQIAIINKLQILERATLNDNSDYDEIENELKPFDDQLELLEIQIKEQENVVKKILADYN